MSDSNSKAINNDSFALITLPQASNHSQQVALFQQQHQLEHQELTLEETGRYYRCPIGAAATTSASTATANTSSTLQQRPPELQSIINQITAQPVLIPPPVSASASAPQNQQQQEQEQHQIDLDASLPPRFAEYDSKHLAHTTLPFPTPQKQESYNSNDGDGDGDDGELLSIAANHHHWWHPMSSKLSELLVPNDNNYSNMNDKNNQQHNHHHHHHQHQPPPQPSTQHSLLQSASMQTALTTMDLVATTTNNHQQHQIGGRFLLQSSTTTGPSSTTSSNSSSPTMDALILHQQQNLIQNVLMSEEERKENQHQQQESSGAGGGSSGHQQSSKVFPSVVCDAQDLKTLITAPFRRNNNNNNHTKHSPHQQQQPAPLSMFVHRIGDTMFLDAGMTTTQMMHQPPSSTTTKQNRSKTLASKLIYLSIAAAEEQHQHQRQQEEEQAEEEEDKHDNNNSNTNNPFFSQVLRWKFDDLSALIGTKPRPTLVSKETNGPVSLLLKDVSVMNDDDDETNKNNNNPYHLPSTSTTPPPTTTTESTSTNTSSSSSSMTNIKIDHDEALDLWLDNVMNNIPHVAVCLHVDGKVQGYHVMPTNKLPSLCSPPGKPFEPVAVLKHSREVLKWLQVSTQDEDGSYVLIKEDNNKTNNDDDDDSATSAPILKLFKVRSKMSSASATSSAQDTNVAASGEYNAFDTNNNDAAPKVSPQLTASKNSNQKKKTKSVSPSLAHTSHKLLPTVNSIDNIDDDEDEDDSRALAIPSSNNNNNSNNKINKQQQHTCTTSSTSIPEFDYPLALMCFRMAQCLPYTDAETFRLMNNCLELLGSAHHNQYQQDQEEPEDNNNLELPLAAIKAVAYVTCAEHLRSSSLLSDSEAEQLCLQYARSAIKYLAMILTLNKNENNKNNTIIIIPALQSEPDANDTALRLTKQLLLLLAGIASVQQRRGGGENVQCMRTLALAQAVLMLRKDEIPSGLLMMSSPELELSEPQHQEHQEHQEQQEHQEHQPTSHNDENKNDAVDDRTILLEIMSALDCVVGDLFHSLLNTLMKLQDEHHQKQQQQLDKNNNNNIALIMKQQTKQQQEQRQKIDAILKMAAVASQEVGVSELAPFFPEYCDTGNADHQYHVVRNKKKKSFFFNYPPHIDFLGHLEHAAFPAYNNDNENDHHHDHDTNNDVVDTTNRNSPQQQDLIIEETSSEAPSSTSTPVLGQHQHHHISPASKIKNQLFGIATATTASSSTATTSTIMNPTTTITTNSTSQLHHHQHNQSNNNNNNSIINMHDTSTFFDSTISLIDAICEAGSAAYARAAAMMMVEDKNSSSSTTNNNNNNNNNKHNKNKNSSTKPHHHHHRETYREISRKLAGLEAQIGSYHLKQAVFEEQQSVSSSSSRQQQQSSSSSPSPSSSSTFVAFYYDRIMSHLSNALARFSAAKKMFEQVHDMQNAILMCLNMVKCKLRSAEQAFKRHSSLFPSASSSSQQQQQQQKLSIEEFQHLLDGMNILLEFSRDQNNNNKLIFLNTAATTNNIKPSLLGLVSSSSSSNSTSNKISSNNSSNLFSNELRQFRMQFIQLCLVLSTRSLSGVIGPSENFDRDRTFGIFHKLVVVSTANKHNHDDDVSNENNSNSLLKSLFDPSLHVFRLVINLKNLVLNEFLLPADKVMKQILTTMTNNNDEQHQQHQRAQTQTAPLTDTNNNQAIREALAIADLRTRIHLMIAEISATLGCGVRHPTTTTTSSSSSPETMILQQLQTNTKLLKVAKWAEKATEDFYYDHSDVEITAQKLVLGGTNNNNNHSNNNDDDHDDDCQKQEQKDDHTQATTTTAMDDLHQSFSLAITHLKILLDIDTEYRQQQQQQQQHQSSSSTTQSPPPPLLSTIWRRSMIVLYLIDLMMKRIKMQLVLASSSKITTSSMKQNNNSKTFTELAEEGSMKVLGLIFDYLAPWVDFSQQQQQQQNSSSNQKNNNKNKQQQQQHQQQQQQNSGISLDDGLVGATLVLPRLLPVLMNVLKLSSAASSNNNTKHTKEQQQLVSSLKEVVAMLLKCSQQQQQDNFMESAKHKREALREAFRRLPSVFRMRRGK